MLQLFAFGDGRRVRVGHPIKLEGITFGFESPKNVNWYAAEQRRANRRVFVGAERFVRQFVGFSIEQIIQQRFE